MKQETCIAEAQRRKLQRRDESAWHLWSAIVLAIWQAGRRRSSSPYGEPGRGERDDAVSARHMARMIAFQLAIWRAGRCCSSSPYDERDDAVPARCLASRLRSRSSFGYLWAIQMVREWWSAFFLFHCLSPWCHLPIDRTIYPENFSYNVFKPIRGFSLDFLHLFLEEIFLVNLRALIFLLPILTPANIYPHSCISVLNFIFWYSSFLNKIFMQHVIR